jgi:hypothetical protein
MTLAASLFWHWPGCPLATAAERAEDLASVYQRSAGDPRMQQAEALHLATRETHPGLAGDAAAGRERVEELDRCRQTVPPIRRSAPWPCRSICSPGTTGSTSSRPTPSSPRARTNYVAAQYDLIARVAQQYFGVLSAQDTDGAGERALQSVARQLEQAERRYEVGLIAITDVQIARASRGTTAAAVIAARRQLASAQEQLRAITGEKYAALAAPREDMLC